MKTLSIRPATPDDRAAIRAVEEAAFGQTVEADLVERLVSEGSVVLEWVAEKEGRLIGHILYSRLLVEGGEQFSAVALAPLAVHPEAQKFGVGSALVRESHAALKRAGERLSIVLGDPGYYGRFGYTHVRAAGFDSDYQCEALQALDFDSAPVKGRLAYAPAFSVL